MPLISQNVVRVTCPSEDEGGEKIEEWYNLREQVGYLERRVIDLGFISGRELNEQRTKNPYATVTELLQGIAKDKSLAEIDATEDINKVYFRLDSWSHADPLTIENVNRIPESHMEKLLEEIEKLEKASQPFRDETAHDEGSN